MKRHSNIVRQLSAHAQQDSFGTRLIDVQDGFEIDVTYIK
jgi:hypothetical protein